jgi:hypothetical protein
VIDVISAIHIYALFSDYELLHRMHLAVGPKQAAPIHARVGAFLIGRGEMASFESI